MGKQKRVNGLSMNPHIFPAESANALNRQPGKISFTLFDEAIKQSFVKEGLIKGVHRLFPSGTKMPEIDRHLQREAKEGTGYDSRFIER